jgi:hypothetical protein
VTVAVACNLSDGVILGVDSAVSVPAPQGIVKVYENAEKLFQLGERPIGVATYGLGALGMRSIGSYVREFEVRDPDGVIEAENAVADVVEALRAFFMDGYNREILPHLQAQDIPTDQWPVLGLVVGGFSAKAYLSEVWNIVIPQHDQPNSAEQQRGQGEFGSNWFAMFEPIRRYIKGFDPSLVDELLGYIIKLRGTRFIASEEQQIQEILAKHEYQIPFTAMPMRMGVEFTRWLVDLVVNHHRYTIGALADPMATGAPIVGGEVRIGTVTYRREPFQLLEN